MRIWVTLHRNNKIIARTDASSEIYDPADALLECLEQAYKALDISEPVWVSKHAKDLANFGRTKFFPGDFIDPVNFDYMEVEYISQV